MNDGHIVNHQDFSKLPDEALVSPNLTAIELDVAPGTLANWRCQGNYDLAVTMVGRLAKYRVGDIRAFKNRNRRATGDECAEPSERLNQRQSISQ